MEIILLEKIYRLGDLGDQVKVKAGYGRNYLIPSGKAVPATPENVEKLEAKRAELEKIQAEVLDRARARAEKLNTIAITIVRKTAGEDKLFGSVGTTDIAEAVTQAGAELAKHEIHLPGGPLRATGEYNVHVQLHADVEATIKLTIVTEEE
jgi:large subunit ribosomal protein L9